MFWLGNKNNNTTHSFLQTFSRSIKYVATGLDKYVQRKIVNIFLPIVFSICFGCSKELSHSDGSFEYPQHMFWLRNKKMIFCYTLLTKCLMWPRNIVIKHPLGGVYITTDQHSMFTIEHHKHVVLRRANYILCPPLLYT